MSTTFSPAPVTAGLRHQLETRVLPVSPEVADDHFRLDALAPGESATVAGFCAGVDPAVIRRLNDLGLAPGQRVEVLRKAPLQDPVVVRACDCEIALRRCDAAGVILCPCADE